MLVVFTKNDFTVGTDRFDRIEGLNRKAYDLVTRVPFALSYVDGQARVLKKRDPEFQPDSDIAGINVHGVLKQIDKAEKDNELSGFGIV